MNSTTTTHSNTIRQEKNLNILARAKNALLKFTGYLTLAAATFPIIFTTMVFIKVASTGNLSTSISKVLLG